MFERRFVERFKSRLMEVPETGCLEWTGAIDRKGYGVLGGTPRRTLRAHRVAWQLAYGEVPNGLYVCHRCDRPNCCEPTHLFIGTAFDNNIDKVAKGRQEHGELHHSAKLKACQVREIKRALAAGEPMTCIANRFGVVYGTIHAIKSGRSWRGLQ